MKQLISSLLDAISPYEFSNCDIEELIVLAADALESGALDCLVEHPGHRTPDDDRPVFVRYPGGYAAGFYRATRDEWIINHGGGRLKTVRSWWELPLGVEEPK